MKLTAKQKRFIQEYMIDFNGTQAAVRSGYSEKTAYSIAEENLKKPDIKSEIERLQAETSNKLEITKETLIKDLLKIKDMCIDNPRVTHNSIKAIEVITKMLGFNEPKKQEITLNKPIDISKLIGFEDDDEKQQLND